MSVDTAQGVISHIQADSADSRDSRYLAGLVSSVQYRLMQNELRMSDLLADAGYSNGYNYKLLEQEDINAWIPVFGKYKPEVEGFLITKWLTSLYVQWASHSLLKHWNTMLMANP